MIPNNVMQIISKFNPNLNNLKDINTPDDMAQLLLNSGRVNQAQVNQARQMWGNPQVQQMVQSKFRF